MAFRVSPLPGQDGFGAIVTGLAPADLDDEGVKTSLRALWIDAGVIVFRGLEGGEESHLRLSRIFGTLQDHMMFRGQPDYHPELIELRYTGEQETYEVDGEDRGAWLPWHSDLIYTDRINRGGILRPVVLPRRGGETGFIDRINAYNRLPDELKARFEGLNVLYLPDFDATHQKYGRATSLKLTRTTERMQAAIAQKLPRTIHPLVYAQPETGRKVLNVSPWFANAIQGMENEEGDAILRAAIEHLIRPDLAYFHEWQPEDMVLWDNWRMTHCAKGVPTDDRRIMRRTTIAGDYALGRGRGRRGVSGRTTDRSLGKPFAFFVIPALSRDPASVFPHPSRLPSYVREGSGTPDQVGNYALEIGRAISAPRPLSRGENDDASRRERDARCSPARSLQF